MIFQRAVLKEQITLTGVIAFVLFTIMTVFFLVRTLDEVSAGMVALDILPQYILMITLAFFPVTIVATIVVAVVNTIARMYKDSEMVIWQTSGLSYWSVFKPVAALVVPMFLFLLFVNAVLVPWSSKKLAIYEKNSVMTQLSMLKSGSFHGVNKGAQTIFVDKVSEDARIPSFEHIYMLRYEPAVRVAQVIYAKDAKPVQDAMGMVALQMGSGQQYSVNLTSKVTNMATFDGYLLDMSQYLDTSKIQLNELPVNQLAIRPLWTRSDAKARAELFKRLSNAVILLPMALFAIAVAFTRPRATRHWGVLLGVLILVIYSNAINYGFIAVERGRAGIVPMFLAVHGGAFGLAFLLIGVKFNLWRTWWARWQMRRGGQA